MKIPFTIPTYEILRAAEPPAVDGWLEAPGWRGAHWIDRFLTVETAAPTDKPTQAAMLWDDRFLYVGFRCEEPRLGYVRANASQARQVWNDDAIEIYLNPGIPGVESVDTSVNVVGQACPALRIITDPGWGTYQFQEPGGVRAAVRYRGTGWQAEVAIPFGEHRLPSPKAGDTWRGNLCRNDRLGYTWSYWALGESPGYTYSDGQLFPYLRFSDTVSQPAPAPAGAPAVRPAWPRQPRFALRGMMYDTSRGSQVFRRDYWTERLSLLRDLGYNALIMYFENHLRYPSHPEFAPEGSWTLADLTGLQEDAALFGIDIIPAQTSLGHCPGILTHPRYRPLAEEGSDGYQFCVAHPETHQVLADIFGELAGASRSPWVNINADESAYLGLCPRCQEKFAGWSKGRIFRHHLLKLYEVIRAHGKRMMMWDDMLWLYPDALDGLPRDIVLLDWHYTFHRRYPSVDVWRAEGFDVVVCPGMYLVENAFWLADYGAERGAMGLMNTLWEDHSLPLGNRWHHLLATSWAAHAVAPSDMERWYVDAAVHCFGLGAERLGRSMAAVDQVARNGYRSSEISATSLFGSGQVAQEAERLLAAGPSQGLRPALLEEFVHARQLLLLQSQVADARARDALDPARRAELGARAAALKEQALDRWRVQCTVPSQQLAYLERFTEIERELSAGTGREPAG